MKISVVTAVFNSERTVSHAIKSVADQDYDHVQHLVQDGDSSDNSISEIMKSNHENLEFISEPDLGIYDAFNKGINRASGDVIGFLHSDDFFPNTSVLSTIATAFQDQNIECVYGDLDYVSYHDPKKTIRRWRSEKFSSSQLKKGWMPPHPTLYLRRSVFDRIGLFDTNFEISADYDFVLRYFSTLAGRESSALHIPQVLYKMRLGGASNSSLSKIFRKMKEDNSAIRRNNVGGFSTLAAKNLSKISQFF